MSLVSNGLCEQNATVVRRQLSCWFLAHNSDEVDNDEEEMERRETRRREGMVGAWEEDEPTVN